MAMRSTTPLNDSPSPMGNCSATGFACSVFSMSSSARRKLARSLSSLFTQARSGRDRSAAMSQCASGDRADEKEAAFANRHRPIGIGEEVGEARSVEQVGEHAIVLGESDVGGDGEVALGLFRIDVEVAGGPVLGGARRRVVAQERFGERGLSCAVMGDDGDVADGLGIEHVEGLPA